MRRQYMLIVVVLFSALLLASCGDMPTQDAPKASPLASISDAVHENGNAHFFFLPPMVPDPSTEFSAAFDGSFDVLVEICVWSTVYDECGAPLELYNMVSGAGSETVRISGESYVVNWHTDSILDNDELALEEGDVYRIRVLVGDRELGHADLEVVGSGKELKNVDTDEFIPSSTAAPCRSSSALRNTRSTMEPS